MLNFCKTKIANSTKHISIYCFILQCFQRTSQKRRRRYTNIIRSSSIMTNGGAVVTKESPLEFLHGSDDEVDDDNCTSRTENVQSQHQSKHSQFSKGTNSSQLSRSTNTTMNLSVSTPPDLPCKENSRDLSSKSNQSHFEINCSPTEANTNEQSHYKQARMRQKRQQQEEKKRGGKSTASPNVSRHIPKAKTRTSSNKSEPSTLDEFDVNSKGYEDLPDTQAHYHNISDSDEESEENGDDDDQYDCDKSDNSSCCPLADSTMSIGNDSLAEDNTMINSNISGTCDHTEASNTLASTSQNSTHSNSATRGKEHISSRMKKYGLVNIHEMKRKRLQRRHSCSASIKECFENSNQAESVTSGLSDDISGSGTSSGRSSSVSDIPLKIRTAPLHVQMAVQEIHRWLFSEGGHFEDVQTLMTQYSLYVREHLGIPLDRMFCGGIGLHPKLTAYTWQWEAHSEFVFKELPSHIFERRNEIFSPDEPFCVLEQGRADHIRIRNSDSYIPPDTAKWFRGGKYKDYFALPDIHRGVSKGGLAWSTKCPDGFTDDDIQFFRMTHAALTTIMRLHTNDLVLNTLTDRMETEIKDRTDELAIANQKLEEANMEISRHASKQLEHFACMSHEIRTPLNCIVGLSSLLLESEDLNDDLLDNIQMVYNSADLVQGVVNDVLDYAKIESGHFELDIRPSDLQTTLNGVVHSISNKLQAKNVELRTSYCGKLGPMMTTDSRRLQQILYNILGNAAKFSREGTSIDFKVRVIEANSGDNGNESIDAKHLIRFSIKDYGKGIEEENFEKIFQPFSQASKETQTIYGGTGLGLSITKNLVVRLGGTISIKSEIDKFTEFIVDLPYNEELVDGAKFKEKLLDTSIVILDPKERSTNALPLEEDYFVPFPTDVTQQYNLNVMRCLSWSELESKLGLKANIRDKYVFIAHEDIEERQGILNSEKLVKRERCTWFTFGSDSPLHQRRKHHFKTLTGIFPSALVEKISEGVADQQKIGSDSMSSYSSSGSFESLWSSSSVQDEIEQEEEEDAQPARGCTHKRSNKKVAKKYPPRDLKILIAEDNVINQKVLDRTLKRLGVAEVTIVDNGKKAVDITKTTKFDCILMDMEMPIMGGLEACKLIVEQDKDAKVAFVTAHDIEDIREKADAAGAYGYITKPLKMNDIHEFLEKLEVRSTNSSRGPSNDNGKTTETTHAASAVASPKKRSTCSKNKRRTKRYPVRKLKILVAEDNKINQKVIVRILTHLGVSDVTVVDNGEKAVEASGRTTFDCILMDMQMPVMDGVQACEIIMKRDKEKPDCPKVVFVTAHALMEFKEKALAAGCFDFITKPFKKEDINNLLEVLETTKFETTTSESVVLTKEEESSQLSSSPSIESPKKIQKTAHVGSSE